MANPLLWLSLSILLLAMSLTAMMLMAMPALRELARAARSAERLFDTLNHELPPTLEALRLTGAEITELTDGVSDSLDRASHTVKQVDQGLHQVRHQAKQAEQATRSLWVGCKAAWKTLMRPRRRPQSRSQSRSQSGPRAVARQRMTQRSQAASDRAISQKASDRPQPSAAPDLSPNPFRTAATKPQIADVTDSAAKAPEQD